MISMEQQNRKRALISVSASFSCLYCWIVIIKLHGIKTLSTARECVASFRLQARWKRHTKRTVTGISHRQDPNNVRQWHWENTGLLAPRPVTSPVWGWVVTSFVLNWRVGSWPVGAHCCCGIEKQWQSGLKRVTISVLTGKNLYNKHTNIQPRFGWVVYFIHL